MLSVIHIHDCIFAWLAQGAQYTVPLTSTHTKYIQRHIAPLLHHIQIAAVYSLEWRCVVKMLSSKWFHFSLHRCYMYNMKGVVTKPTCRIYSLCCYSRCVLFMVGGDLTSMRLATTFLAYLWHQPIPYMGCCCILALHQISHNTYTQWILELLTQTVNYVVHSKRFDRNVVWWFVDNYCIPNLI